MNPPTIGARPPWRVLYRTHRWHVIRDGGCYVLRSLTTGYMLALMGDDAAAFARKVADMLAPTKGAKPLPYVLGVDRVCDQFLARELTTRLPSGE